MNSDLVDLCLPLDSTIRQVIACIDRNARGIALIVDGESRLLGTITDGDVRRALLAAKSLDTPVNELLALKANSEIPEPVTAPVGTEQAVLLQIMQERVVHQIPLLDSDRRVAGLVTLDELLPDRVLPLQAVIMAGGLGTRLRPLTENLPKPMLPIGGRPLLELIIEQLRQAGIRHVSMTTHYKPEKIMEHFGDGRDFGVELHFVTENRPLGTAGALGLIGLPDEPFLVINGDILTRIDFRAMMAFHREQNAHLTVAVSRYDLQVPYGVVECEGARVRQVREKPSLSFFVNAGIYLLEPEVRSYIPRGQHFDMTDLIQCLIEDRKPVVGFPVIEYWLDIGQHADYLRAQEDVKGGMTV